MAQFKAFAEGVEVNGQTVLTIVDGCTIKDLAFQILANNGIKDPQPEQWYPQQDWLNAFKEIAVQIGQNTLYSIGLKIPENAQFPPEIDSIVKALSAIDVAYHMNHRGGEIGHYGFELTSDTAATMVCNNPYPCDFDRGIIESMATRFKPEELVFTSIRHDDTVECRKKGGESCTYHVTW